jgi:hypothetical protein
VSHCPSTCFISSLSLIIYSFFSFILRFADVNIASLASTTTACNLVLRWAPKPQQILRRRNYYRSGSATHAGIGLRLHQPSRKLLNTETNCPKNPWTVIQGQISAALRQVPSNKYEMQKVHVKCVTELWHDIIKGSNCSCGNCIVIMKTCIYCEIQS